MLFLYTEFHEICSKYSLNIGYKDSGTITRRINAYFCENTDFPHYDTRENTILFLKKYALIHQDSIKYKHLDVLASYY